MELKALNGWLSLTYHLLQPAKPTGRRKIMITFKRSVCIEFSCSGFLVLEDKNVTFLLVLGRVSFI